MTDEVIETPGALAEAAASESRFPGFWVSIGWIVLYFVLQGVCTVLLLIAVGETDPAAVSSAVGNPVVILWGLVLSAFIQLGLMWLYLRKHGRSERIGIGHFGHMPALHATGLAFVLVVAAMIFNYLYATYIIPGIGMQEEMAKMLAAIPRTPLNIAAGIFAIVIAAPLVEELLFRGLLQNAIARYVPIWAAILLSSLISLRCICSLMPSPD